MARILFLDADAGDAVGTAFGRQIEIDDLRKLLHQQRHEDFVQRLTQHRGFIRRLAGVGRVVNRVAAQRDAIHREHGETILLVVIAGVVAEGAFERSVVGMNMTFEHDFGTRGHLQIMRQALRDFGFFAAQQSGELVFGQ